MEFQDRNAGEEEFSQAIIEKRKKDRINFNIQDKISNFATRLCL